MRALAIPLACILGFVALAACGDDAPKADGGSTATTSAIHCRKVTDADSFCSCEPTTTAPADETATCDDTTSANVACCLAPGTTGAGQGQGLCGCKLALCSEFSDGSCTCRTGAASTDKPVETCEPPDQGHCCRSEGTYCTCSSSPCFDGDEEVASCNPANLAKTACAAGETKVSDCKAALAAR